MDCDYGIVLNYPAFTKYYLEYGEISTYPAGYKENGGIFCHNNPWIMIGETIQGRGDQAYDYCQMIAGKEAHKPGEAKNSWLSGTASWNFYAITQYILGIRAEYDGLAINPCIPAAWDGFKMKRVFRDVTYNINVKNPEHISKGIKQILVNGQPINSNIVPILEKGKEHSVEVLMG